MTERVSSPTEGRNPRTTAIDTLETLDLLRVINDEDALVAPRVREVLPAVATLVEAAVAALRAGGSVHYFGAGTSGRLGLLDAVELVPTYGTDPAQFVAHLAGGDAAIRRAVEGAEDDPRAGADAATAAGLDGDDVAIGLAASGRTPYVAGALAAARERGAVTGLITSNPGAPIAADVLVAVDTGPEAIAGSTRMKSATAQKLVLNAFSTAVMVRLGRTYSNLMLSVTPTNAKLRGRLVQILIDATGCDEARCADALERAGGELPTALVTLLAGVEPERARAALAQSGGVAAGALRALGAAPPPP